MRPRRSRRSRSRSRSRSAPALYQQAKALRGLPDPDHAATPHSHNALPQVPESLCPFPQRDAGGPPLRKAESRRAYGRCARSRGAIAKRRRRAGSTVRPMPSACARARIMTVPIRTPCRVRGERSIEGCERPRHARGWCSHHWRRWHRHGDPLASRCPREHPKENVRRHRSPIDRTGDVRLSSRRIAGGVRAGRASDSPRNSRPLSPQAQQWKKENPVTANPACQRRSKIGPKVECAPEGGQDQAAVLTGCRAC